MEDKDFERIIVEATRIMKREMTAGEVQMVYDKLLHMEAEAIMYRMLISGKLSVSGMVYQNGDLADFTLKVNR